MKYTLKSVKPRKDLGEFVNVKKARAEAYAVIVGKRSAEVIIEDGNKAVVGKVVVVNGQPVFRKDGERDFAVNADGSMSAIKGEPVRPGKKKEKREREGSRFGPFHLVDSHGFSVAESASRKGILAKAYRLIVDSGFKRNTFAVTDKDMASMGTVFGLANEGKVYLRADGKSYKVDEDGNYAKVVPKKAVTVNDTEGDYVIAVRNDNTGSVRFMGRGGLTSNPKYALKYSKKTASTEVKSDKAKAGIVAKRLNKERPSMSGHEYFVTELEYGTKIGDEGKSVKDYNNPLRIKDSRVVFDRSRTSRDEGRFIIAYSSGREANTKRARNLNDARKKAIQTLASTPMSAIFPSVTVASVAGDGSMIPLGIVKQKRVGNAKIYQWWTRKVITRSAYDVKGRRVQGQSYVKVAKFVLDTDGKIAKTARPEKEENAEDDLHFLTQLEEMQREFAKAGINFKIDAWKKP